MTCEQSEQLILQALDGALNSRERASLDAHLLTCAPCQQARVEYGALAQTATAWARAPMADPQDDGFFGRVYARVTERSRASASRARFSWAIMGTFVAAGACVALGAILPPVPLHAPDMRQALSLASATHIQINASARLTGSIGTVSESLDVLSRRVTRGYALPAWVPGAFVATACLNLVLFARVRRQAVS